MRIFRDGEIRSVSWEFNISSMIYLTIIINLLLHGTTFSCGDLSKVTISVSNIFIGVNNHRCIYFNIYTCAWQLSMVMCVALMRRARIPNCRVLVSANFQYLAALSRLHRSCADCKLFSDYTLTVIRYARINLSNVNLSNVNNNSYDYDWIFRIWGVLIHSNLIWEWHNHDLVPVYVFSIVWIVFYRPCEIMISSNLTLWMHTGLVWHATNYPLSMLWWRGCAFHQYLIVEQKRTRIHFMSFVNNSNDHDMLLGDNVWLINSYLASLSWKHAMTI